MVGVILDGCQPHHLVDERLLAIDIDAGGVVVDHPPREGFGRSQVMHTARYLTDEIGPRITGTPALKRANEWTLARRLGAAPRDILVNGPASIAAAIGLWKMKQWGYATSQFVAGFYVYASVEIFVHVAQDGPPYAMEIASISSCRWQADREPEDRFSDPRLAPGPTK